MQQEKINRYGRQNLALLSQNQQMESGSHAELIYVVCVSKQRGFTAHMLRGVAENLLSLSLSLSLSLYIYIYIYIYIYERGFHGLIDGAAEALLRSINGGIGWCRTGEASQEWNTNVREQFVGTCVTNADAPACRTS
jgi:hypothetical protein